MNITSIVILEMCTLHIRQRPRKKAILIEICKKLVSFQTVNIDNFLVV